MITAIVLINAAIDHIPEIAEQLAEIDGISEVYSVAGRYDLIAILRVTQHEEVADVMTHQVDKVEGIRSSETLIAFRAYSRHDLDAAFSIGARPLE